MTDKQAEAIVNTAKSQLKESFNDELDAIIGLHLIVQLLTLCRVNDLPTGDKRFCEVLRVFANILEIANNTEVKK